MLEALLSSPHTVLAAYTQPDRPAGRGRKLKPSPVKALALEHSIDVHQPTAFGTEEIDTLRALNLDIMVVAAYGLLLPTQVLAAPTGGCMNVHASLLPRWRGAAPIQRAILAGDEHSGVTIMQMDAGLDTGDMLIRDTCDIGADDTAGSLHDKLAKLGARALLTALAQYGTGMLVPEPQDNSLSCYASRLSKQEAEIDWRQSAKVLQRAVRAYNPWPVAYTTIEGQRLRIFEASIFTGDEQVPPGRVVASDKSGIVVATGHGCLELRRVQLPGARIIDAATLARARPALLGATLGG